jgi:hypothetical protein
MDDFSTDYLLGWHKVKKGNKETQSSFTRKGVKNDKFRNYSIIGYYNGRWDRVELSRFTDIQNNTNPGSGRINLMNDSTMSIEMSILGAGAHFISKQEINERAKKYQLPLEMILKRVE